MGGQPMVNLFEAKPTVNSVCLLRGRRKEGFHHWVGKGVEREEAKKETSQRGMDVNRHMWLYLVNRVQNRRRGKHSDQMPDL